MGTDIGTGLLGWILEISYNDAKGKVPRQGGLRSQAPELGLGGGKTQQILKSETGLQVISVSDRAHTEQHHAPMLVTFSWGYLSLKDDHTHINKHKQIVIKPNQNRRLIADCWLFGFSQEY